MDPAIVFTTASAGLAALSIASAAALKGWSGWLELKRLEMADRRPEETPTPSPSARIEMADLKERVRKLEAIAAGIEI